MKLVQEAAFSPIAIILETRAEAEMFWKIVREVDCPNNAEYQMVRAISDLFSNKAKL